MTFLEIALLGVRNFQQITRFEFSPALNFILGGNGSGKTTFRDTLLLSLFSHNPDLEKTLIHHSSPSTCQCAITFRTREGEVFRLAKDFIKDVRILSKFDPTTQKFLQIEKRKENVLRWLQQRCGGLEGDQIAYYFSLDRSRLPSNMAFRIRSDQPGSASDLDQPSGQLGSEAGWHSDRPSEPGTKLTRLQELKSLADKAEQVYQWEEQLSDAQSRVRVLKRRLDALQDLDRELEQINEKTRGFAELAERMDKVQEMVEEFEEKLEERNREQRTLEEDRTLLEHQINLVPTDPIYKHKSFIVGAIATTLSIGTAFFVSLPGLYQHLYLLGLLIGLGLMAASIVLDARWLSRKKILEDKFNGKLKNVELLEARFKRENAKFFELLKKTDTDSLEAFKERLNAYQLVSATRQLLLEERSRVSEGMEPEALQNEYEEQMSLVHEVENKIRNYEEVPPDLPTLNEEISILEKEVAAQWQGQIDPNRISAPHSADQQGPSLRLGNGYYDPIKTLLHDPLVPNLEQVVRTARAIFEKLSLGAYRELIVDASSASDDRVSLLPRDSSEPVKLHELSSGTLDQVFLSLYLGMIMNLGPDYSFPLILDDPLLMLDYQRQKIILEILREISQQRQLIIMSHLPYPRREGEKQIKLA